jgi:1-aminocyclopropane-1-carboxylate deaminase/D-cysteine desulfhydrase-like pyridoxal-dependent ACC family enzyme
VIPELTLPSPQHRLHALSTRWDLDLWAKRDDLIPQFLGGNKARKVHRIVTDTFERHGRYPDVMITNGSVHSNHARVVAMIAAVIGCQAHLVLHGREVRPPNPAGNGYFYRAAGARTHCVEPDAIADTIAFIRSEQESAGNAVLVIPGGGHTTVGARAYDDAVDELTFEPDIIIMPSGTGGTQAGLVRGVARRGWSTRVIGVSVARSAQRGSEAVRQLLGPSMLPEAIRVLDGFRFGGYGKVTAPLWRFIQEIVQVEGIPLDPTYTGKAMFALAELRRSNEIKAGARVLFWHTGGLLNLQTAVLPVEGTSA